MKIFKFFYNIMLAFILVLSFFCLYDIYVLSNWLNEKLTNKFVINLILNDNINIDNLLNEIYTMENKNLKFKDIKYITKEEFFDELKNSDELGAILSVIEENPFFNFIRINLKFYKEIEVSNFLNIIRAKNEIKDVIFDKKLKNYLYKLEYFINFYKFFFFLSLFFIIFIVFYEIKKQIFSQKIYYIAIIAFTPIYIFLYLTNIKFLEFIMSKNINLNYTNYIFYIFLYLVFILFINKKNNEN